eukprot:jgi/Ulvmu1/294/UM001_0298.1
MRAEVESPFRTFRIALLTFFLLSASIASLVATSQLIGSLGNAPAAMPLANTSQTFGIDIACVGVIAYFLRGDLQARDKQIARIGREESLASLRLELASGKTLPLGRLRSFCRPVMFYGTAEQVEKAREAAAPFKEELLRRGVFLVPLPLKGDANGAAALPPLDKDDKESAKWEGRAVRTNEWRDWFEKQASTANKNTDAGLYVGLRLDGRVRASGAGAPPWSIFAKQLAPVEGMWGGFLDGMDGRVGG